MAVEPVEVIDGLVAATNAHDLDALVASFADDYVNETPAHPARGFRGKAQVRRNWQQIFASVPDIAVDVTHRAVDGSNVWTEWAMRGRRRDGSAHLMAGVIVFNVADSLIQSARFYLEPVDTSNTTADEAVARQVVPE